jgi:pullulanase
MPDIFPGESMHVLEPVIPHPPKGIPLATLEVAAPPGHVGAKIIATLKSHGRILAQGQSSVSAFDEARILLFMPEHIVRPGSGDYELWVTLDLDGTGTWYPGFGDWYIHDTWHFQHGPWKTIHDVSLWKEKRLSSPANLLRVHYHRFGGYDEDIGLWTWNEHSTVAHVEVFDVRRDEFGLVFELDKADYGEVTAQLRIGLLPRLGGDWTRKEDENKYWDSSLGNEIFLIGTIKHIWKERPDTRQQVLAAFIDTPNCLIVELSRPVDPGEILPEQIFIEDGQNRQINIGHIVHGDRPANALKVRTVQTLDAGSNTYFVSLEHFGGLVTASLRDILDEPDLFYDAAAELGAHHTPAYTTFRVFAPTATQVDVVLYHAPTDSSRTPLPYRLRKAEKGIFEGVMQGDLNGKYYRYRLEGPGFDSDKEVLDPYCVNSVAASQYGRITALAATNPPDWEKHRLGPALASPVDMVVYEIHVRDFTIAENSGVTHKGKYLGFTEAGSHLPGNKDITTGLDHLQELGITHVQLLPVQSFRKDPGDGIYNWGYMTVAFNSPEAWYATDANDDSKVREFKQLVAALHARNIGVIMDVVYNHTDHSAPFTVIAPQYYYRFFGKGNYSNGSGVGNDLRTESPMARKYIIDTLKYWVSEYGVDGFRFDLMALIDSETMRLAEIELRKLKPDIVIYGEPWSSGFSPMKGHPTDKSAIRHTGIGAFNDHFRNALGGSPNGSEAGFLQNGSRRDQLILGIEGSCRDWASSPAHSINYMTCHDNLVLSDKLRWFNASATEAEIQDAMKLGYLLLFTSQGVPLLHGGEEFARTKCGHGNSYNAGDEINQLDWSLKAENYALFTYTRDLIAVRKQHPLFRLARAEETRERIKFLPAPTEKALLYWIDGAGLKAENWQEACVLVNGEDTVDLEFILPHGRWIIAVDNKGLTDGVNAVEHRTVVRRKSGLILCRIKEVALIVQAPPVIDETPASIEPIQPVEIEPVATILAKQDT